MKLPRTHRMRWTPDEPPAGGAPAAETPPPAAPPAQQQPGQDPAAASTTPPPDGGKTKPEPETTGDELSKMVRDDPDKAAKEIKRLRAEAKKRGDELQQIRDKQKAADDAAMAEQGKFKELAETRAKDIDELKAAHQKERIGWMVQIAAAKMNFNDPEDANVDAVLSKVKVGKDGDFEGIEEALKAYVQQKPYLVKQESAPAPAGAPKIAPTNPGGAPTMTRDDLKKLTPAQVAAMPPDQLAAILSRGQ